jgi:hypothetical protein
VLLLLTPPDGGNANPTFNVVQEENGQVVGGNTFVLRVGAAG